MQEVSRHNRRDDGWIVVDGKVYNITNFINNHPGWTNGGQTSTVLAICRNLGKDATVEFRAIHSAAAQSLLPQYLVGEVVGLHSLPEDALEQVALCCDWRDASRFGLVCRRRWQLQPPRATCVGVDLNDEDDGSTSYAKSQLQGLGSARIEAPLEALRAVDIQVVRMNSLRILIGVDSVSFDCAGMIHESGVARPYAERVSEGSVVSLRKTEDGVAFFIDGRDMGNIPIVLAAGAMPFVRFQNSAGDSVRVLRPSKSGGGIGTHRAKKPQQHALHDRVVVKMLGPDASDFFSFKVDPVTTTLAKLKRLLRIVLRARQPKGIDWAETDLDIIIRGQCCFDDTNTLGSYGVAFVNGAQIVDVYANLPHTVS